MKFHHRSPIAKLALFAAVVAALLCMFAPDAEAVRRAAQTAAAPPAGGGLDFLGFRDRLPLPLEILIFLSLLSFIPGILVMFTSFTRIVVVLSFLRQALGAQQVPPNPVIIGLSLFLTFFIMQPVLDTVNKDALKPYLEREITIDAALERASGPVRGFMMKQVREKDLALFLKISKSPAPVTPENVKMNVLVPAFAIGELRKAFEIGFLIYIPFLIVDMIVASIMLSMGMMMVPPVMIALPFKLLLFVLVDGWNLLIGSLVAGFG
jgi:flagellar biosynthetic protein FliP